MVFHMGSWTCSVSIIDPLIGLMARAGSLDLGGQDFNTPLIEFFADEFMKKSHIDPRKDPHVLDRYVPHFKINYCHPVGQGTS